MDPSKVPSFRRPRRTAVLIAAAVAVALTSGCAHRRRASMRPVYLAPAPVVSAPCPGGDCPPAATAAPLSSPVSEPSLEPSSGSLSAPVITSPAPAASSVAPRYSNDTPPPVTGPSVPGLSDEPELLPASPSESSKVSPSPTSKSGVGTGTRGSSATPGSSMRSRDGQVKPTTRSASAPRPRRVALRDDLLPFVNDPADLVAPPKADRPWKYIVLHHSASEAGGYEAIDQEHRKRLGWDGCGYHFVIGNGTDTADGLIEVAQRWSNQKHGVHCRDGKHPDVNEYGIGICLVGDLEKTPPTPKQIEAARALVAYLSDRYAIPAARTETHAHVAASETTCPGRHFPTDTILSAASTVTQR